MARSAAGALYQRQSQAIRDRLSTIAVKTWDSLPGWTTEANNAYAAHMAAMSERAQLSLVNLLISSVSHSTGTKIELEPTDYVGDAVRHSDSFEEHWQIPMFSAWQALGNADDVSEEQDDIVAQARDDVAAQAVTDLAFTQREAMSDMVETEQIAGYWRVPAGDSSCDFCLLIAEQLYHTEDLMDVHVNCQCSVEAADPKDIPSKPDLYPYREDQPEEEPTPVEDVAFQSALNHIHTRGIMSDASQERMDSYLAGAFKGAHPERVRELRSVTLQNQLVNNDSVQGMHKGGSIWLRRDLLSKQADREFNKAERSGWFSTTRGGAMERTTTHEVGHALTSTLTQAERNALDDAAYQAVRTWQATSAGRSAMTYNDALSTVLSEYGTTNANEMLAEIWAEWKLNPNPSSVAKTVGQMMEDMLSKPIPPGRSWGR